MGPTPVASDTATKAARAAAAFLDTLGPERRKRAAFEFGSDERQNWHYIPRPRNGLPRGDMDGAHLEAAEVLMASGLSSMGLDKAKAIIQHERILAGIEKGEGVALRDRSPDRYFFSIFGRPGDNQPWGWKVEGHHLSLNFTMADGDAVSSTPSFFGANPAEVKEGSQKGLRILQAEEDRARELFFALEPGQRGRALIYPEAPPEILTRASRRVETPERVGLSAELMSADQRKMLMSLLTVYTDRKSPDIARKSIRRIESEGISGIFFGWAGSPHRGQGHYYRIHGPSFLIEYDNTQNMANHIHTVWRDIEGDFGLDVLDAHYEQHHD